MLLKRLSQSVNCARAALYAAFGSPGFGITWSVVTFLSGMLYLIYDEHRRRNVEAGQKEDGAEIESSCEAATHGNTPNLTI
jgi:hypothetical protein